MLGFSFSWLTAWGASCFERWCADGVGKEGNMKGHVTKCHPCHAKRHANLLGNLRKRKVCSFPHRHGDATGNQRVETRDVGASKRAFRARLPPIFTLCSFKMDVSCEFSWEPLNLLPRNRCFVRGFRQFSAHLTKCHACHGICTLSPLDSALPMRFAKNTQHDASKVLRLTRKNTSECHECHACHAKRSNATWETSKNDPSGELTIGTAIQQSRGRLRMVADGWATSSEHTLNPKTPRVKREPLLRIRERKGKEGKERERKGQEGKGRERKGKDGKGRERKGKDGKERERKGKEGKGRERKGEEGKGRERKGKEGNGRDRKGKEGNGRERTGKEGKERERKGKKGKERERKGKDGKARERKGKKGKGRERKGKKGKGRERKGKEGKGRERKGKKGKGRKRTGKEGKGRERKGEVDLEISRRRMTVLK